MAGFEHGASEPAAAERTNPRATRVGHALFAIYLVLYGAFVLAAAFAPGLMARTPVAGINLAVLSGLALIVVAFGFALLYDWLCRFSNSRAPARGDGPA